MTQLSTTLKFDRAISQIGVTQDRVSKAQMQMTEGKQILKPSDAPDKSSQITRLKSAIAPSQPIPQAILRLESLLPETVTASE